MNSVTFNTIRTKQINTELVKSALIDLPDGTKKEIAELTGLSVATCGNILKELLEVGEVIEIEAKEANGGRPARCFVYNPNHSYVACLFLTNEKGINRITYAVANMVGEKVHEGTIDVESTATETLNRIISQLIKKFKIIKAIGIGVPGVVNEGVVVDDCDIKELINYPLEAKLSKKYNLKIIVGNDMNLKALGFYRKQNYDGYKSIAVINFPKDNCSGSGIIVDGHIMKGNTNFAGEVSYLPFGCSRDELINRLSSTENSLISIINTVISVIAIINPDTIALTGELIREDMLEPIIAGCSEVIPAKHMPQIIIRENIQADYINGLLSVTIDSLSCEVELVRKRF